MATNVQIIEKSTGSLLETLPFDKLDLAYKKAAEYEEMGIEVLVEAPTVVESLISELGGDERDKAALVEEIEAEILDHN